MKREAQAFCADAALDLLARARGGALARPAAEDDEFEERAAILEHLADFPRRRAEQLAREIVRLGQDAAPELRAALDAKLREADREAATRLIME